MKRYSNKADRKAAWLAATEDMITKLKPSTAGKLEWDSLLHFYYSGLSSDEAAHKYVSARCDE
mgnify:CR=1 FL=1